MYVPLGGDGFTAPFASYVLLSHSVVGDASGGQAVLSAVMDDRYASLIAYLTATDTQATGGDAGLRLDISPDPPGRHTANLHEQLTVVAQAIDTLTIAHTWNPTPTVIPGGINRGRIDMSMLNVLSDDYRLSMLVYLFNIRVRELAPMGPLLWSRGAT